MIPSQTINNLIKYNRSKTIILIKAKEEKDREIQEIHEWWDNGYLTPAEVDAYTLDELTFDDLQDSVADRMNNNYYEDYIYDNQNYLSSTQYNDYEDYLNYPFNYTGTISEDDYWNGYYREDPESEDPEDPDYIWQNGTHYYLIIIRNGLWSDYGAVHFPW